MAAEVTDLRRPDSMPPLTFLGAGDKEDGNAGFVRVVPGHAQQAVAVEPARQLPVGGAAAGRALAALVTCFGVVAVGLGQGAVLVADLDLDLVQPRVGGIGGAAEASPSIFTNSTGVEAEQQSGGDVETLAGAAGVDEGAA